MEHNKIQVELASEQLFECYFLQYNTFIINCTIKNLKLINLELQHIIEQFWRDKMYCQFVIMCLVFTTKIQTTKKSSL